MATVRVLTLNEQPALRPYFSELHSVGWPEFIRHDATVNRFWSRLYSTFADFQILLLVDDVVVAVGNAIPIRWNGTLAGLPAGLNTVLEQGTAAYEAGAPPDTLCALAAIVAPQHRGQALSTRIVQAMQGLVARWRFRALIAPVRPTLKSLYPLIPMERYLQWTHPDGAPFDPWIRVHWRLGAAILRLAPRSMVVAGRVTEWEAWAQMRFPETGEYIIPGALQPVMIDCENDIGTYEDPNVWMKHAAG